MHRLEKIAELASAWSEMGVKLALREVDGKTRMVYLPPDGQEHVLRTRWLDWDDELPKLSIHSGLEPEGELIRVLAAEVAKEVLVFNGMSIEEAFDKIHPFPKLEE